MVSCHRCLLMYAMCFYMYAYGWLNKMDLPQRLVRSRPFSTADHVFCYTFASDLMNLNTKTMKTSPGNVTIRDRSTPADTKKEQKTSTQKVTANKVPLFPSEAITRTSLNIAVIKQEGSLIWHHKTIRAIA